MVGDVAVSRRFPGRSQRRKNFARFCFDRRVPALTQLEDSSWISSRRGSLCRHCGNRDSFAGRVFPLPDRLLHGPRLHAGLAFDLGFLLPSRNRNSSCARRPRNIGNHRQRDRSGYAGAATYSAGDSSSHSDRCPPPNRGESRTV